jgi:hypothetical protein
MADQSQRAKVTKRAAGNASFLVPSDIFSRIEPVGMKENRLENTISEKKVKNYHSLREKLRTKEFTIITKI